MEKWITLWQGVSIYFEDNELLESIAQIFDTAIEAETTALIATRRQAQPNRNTAPDGAVAVLARGLVSSFSPSRQLQEENSQLRQDLIAAQFQQSQLENRLNREVNRLREENTNLTTEVRNLRSNNEFLRRPSLIQYTIAFPILCVAGISSAFSKVFLCFYNNLVPIRYGISRFITFSNHRVLKVVLFIPLFCTFMALRVLELCVTLITVVFKCIEVSLKAVASLFVGSDNVN